MYIVNKSVKDFFNIQSVIILQSRSDFYQAIGYNIL